jgi:antagonist of KipI
MPVHVIEPGALTTVQDLGRYGHAHLGISPGGAADRLSFRIGNRLVGNQENTPALEMTLVGATLEFEEHAIVSISGAECDCTLGACAVPANSPLEVPPGGVLKCGGMKTGVRAYLTIRGGFDVPPVMGSASTHLGGRFGGLEGRRLQAGDVLKFPAARPLTPPHRLKEGALSGWFDGTIRVCRGPQADWFAPEAYEILFSSTYSVSPQSDRSGLRLKGEALPTRRQSPLLTDGNPLGGIQVPPDGQPIVLFVDQQTTGGYPKIACVITADMHRVGQLGPLDRVRFAGVEIPEALGLLRRQEQALQDMFVSLVNGSGGAGRKGHR